MVVYLWTLRGTLEVKVAEERGSRYPILTDLGLEDHTHYSGSQKAEIRLSPRRRKQNRHKKSKAHVPAFWSLL